MAKFRGLGNDFRFASRSLAKSPGFTLTVLLTLMLGIGSATAIFSLVYGLLLRPLPFPDQDSLLLISESTRWNASSSVAYPNFLDWREQQQSFISMGTFRPQNFNLAINAEPERISGAMVSHDFFTTLGVKPIFGRLFTPEEDKPGSARTVLVRESLWRRHFSGGTEVRHQRIHLDGISYSILGILPDSTAIPYNETEVWVPVGLWAQEYQNRRQHPGLRVIGRLKPGSNTESARADLSVIAGRLSEQYPDSNKGSGIQLQTVDDYLFENIRPAMIVLVVAVSVVMMIACFNLANLFLVRATIRRREMAMRTALGAGPLHILRLLSVESLLLCLTGAAGGFLSSYWFVEAIKSVLPAVVPRLPAVGVDRSALFFSTLSGIATGILFGLITGWRAGRTELAYIVAHSNEGVPGGRKRTRVLLIVGEFALTVVLLTGAGLMFRTLDRLYRADLGYTTEQVMTFSYTLPDYAFPEKSTRLKVEQEIMTRLKALPGVSAAGYTSALPLTTRANFNGFTVEGSPAVTAGELPMADTANVSSGYFRTLDIPIQHGRGFDARDRAGAQRVAIIDTVLAERYFPGKDPLGRRLKIGDAASDLPWMEIVGVIRHIEKYGIERQSGPQLYRPALQAPGDFSFTFALRTTSDPFLLIPAIRRAFLEVFPILPVFDFQTMNQRFAASIWSRRLTSLLLEIFAVMAMVLAMVGLYGVQSYMVARRKREMGIRLALGAHPGTLLRQILQQGLFLAGIGIAAGLVISLAVGRLMNRLLYQVSPFDPVSYLAVAVLALSVGLLACWLPAWRASKVDPMAVLRCE